MKIIVWLGNPGLEYKETRHNAGFLALDFLQKKWNFWEWHESKFSAMISEKSILWEKIIFVKPLTFMNLSGNSVAAIVNFYKIPKENLLVISDDIDMDFWKIRYREKWSHGGQNGLRDIITKLGTDAFSRIKIGIGRHEKMSVSDWVLSRFSPEEKHHLETEIFPLVQEKIENFLHI